LREINSRPFEWATKRDARLVREGIITSPAVGSGVRRQLEREGYLRLHKLQLGRRGGQPELCELTPKAEEFLKSVGVVLRERRGKGGIIHQYAQHTLQMFFERRGKHVVIEDGTCGKNVDLTVDGKLACEILISGVEKELRNLAVCLGSYDEVLCVADEAGKLESLRERVEGAFDENERKRIRYALLAEFVEKE
jgi:hypothetical protein